MLQIFSITCILPFKIISTIRVLFSHFESTHCLDHQCTTAWEKQLKVEQSLEDLQGLWGKVLSNCRGLYPSSTNSEPNSQPCRAELTPKKNKKWDIRSQQTKLLYAKRNSLSVHIWLTWIKDANKKAMVKRGLGKVWPPLIRWIICKKINWPGITRRSRILADRWFAPAQQRWTSDCVGKLCLLCKLFQVWFLPEPKNVCQGLEQLCRPSGNCPGEYFKCRWVEIRLDCMETRFPPTPHEKRKGAFKPAFVQVKNKEYEQKRRTFNWWPT